MGILNNFTRLRALGRQYSGEVGFYRVSYTGAPAKINRFTSTIDQMSAIPNGYLPPYSFNLPLKSGGLASYTQLEASLTSNNTMVAGKGLTANLSASMTLTSAELGLIANLIANLSASLTLTDADISAALLLAANINATSAITEAELGAIVAMLATLAGSGTLVNNAVFATAAMSADLSVSNSAVNPDELAAAIWNSVAADFNDTGTMGEKLNDAAIGGDPWSTPLPGSYPVGSAGEILSSTSTTVSRTFTNLKHILASILGKK